MNEPILESEYAILARRSALEAVTVESRDSRRSLLLCDPVSMLSTLVDSNTFEGVVSPKVRIILLAGTESWAPEG